MRKVIILAIFIFSTKLMLGDEKDYSQYHRLINEAEKQFFINKNIDSCLIYYDKAFKDFDFVFAKDLLNAAQIACYNKKPFESYVLRSFDFGVRIEHYQDYPILKDEVDEMLKKDFFKDSIKSKRKNYLSKIDLNYRSWIYDVAIDDQLSKSIKGYDKKVSELLGKLYSKIKYLGFPGEKIIGIDDDKIYSEIEKSELDFSKRVEALNGKKISYFKLDNDLLASKLPILLLIHHKCSYSKLEKIFMDQIKKGNIHPRDVGLIYDNVLRFAHKKRVSYCSSSIPANFFLLNLFTEYPKKISDNIRAVNKLRSEFFIVSVEVDQVKKIYEKEYGFKLFSGFWSCR